MIYEEFGLGSALIVTVVTFALSVIFASSKSFGDAERQGAVIVAMVQAAFLVVEMAAALGG